MQKHGVERLDRLALAMTVPRIKQLLSIGDDNTFSAHGVLLNRCQF